MPKVLSDGVVAQPTSKAFLSAHSLGAASTVSTVMENLMSSELLYRTERGYIVYDRLFFDMAQTRTARCGAYTLEPVAKHRF